MNPEDKGVLDIWTLIHSLSGFTAGLVGIPRVLWILIMVGWEILEQIILTQEEPDWKEPPINIVSDVVFGFIGYEIGNKIKSGE